MSRNPKRIPRILKELKKVWKKYPYFRLMQLIHIVKATNPNAYYCEDEELIEIIKKVLK